MAKISGIVSSNWKNDAELVNEIVRLVREKKPVKPAVYSKTLVGIDERIATLESLIREEPKVTRVIGIWGMGGLGKTTLAGVVFHKLQHEYGGSFLLLNERDRSNKDDLISLKKEIFSQLLGYDVKIYTLDALPGHIVKETRHIKVLIVLDDVNDSGHIKELLGNLEDFGLGSRIIITTRNEQVLKNIEADVKRYELLGLNSSEALELFNLKAFEKLDDQRDEYNKLLERVVRYAQGIPLVLEVLAGHLRGNTQEVWEGELDKLEKMPHKEVYDVMIRSYDDLDREQQQSFLDIACFFLRSCHVISVGDLKFLLKDDESGNSVVSNLERLKEKALITFSKDNFVSMHDVLQETALEIVRRKSIGCPGSCSWMWKLDDIYEALKNDKVETIRSLLIWLPKTKEQKLIPQIFAKMSRLRFLAILEFFSNDAFNRRTLAEGLQFLSTEIRFLNFNDYPLKSLPENFSTEKLVLLKLQSSNVEKLWDDVKNLVNLKTLDLRWSKMLKELPDSSKAINLEVLLLGGCSMLTSVHPSIFSLPKLKKLDLSWCSSITRLASDSHLCKLCYLDLSNCENLITLPELPTSLKTLNVNNCVALVTLPELPTSLKTLRVSGSKALVTLPELPTSLETLDVSSCVALVTLPELPTSLKTLRVSGSKALVTLPELPTSLETLDVSDCKALITLPELPTSLKTLNVNNCVALVTLPELPTSLKSFYPTGCEALVTLPELPTSLKTLSVFDCKALVTLPELPTSLETLCVSGSKALVTLPELPTSLETLRVSGSKALVTLPELPTSLKTFYVSGCEALVTLPELPTSLETLIVSGSKALVTLPELPTSLKTFYVSGCEALVTLPELPTSLETLKVSGFVTLPELPPSIETLNVSYCEALQSLPELPLSLETLKANDCKSLKTVLFPSTAVEQGQGNRKQVLFWNCLNLDEHSLVAIGLNAQINTMKYAHHHLASPDHDHVENYKGSDYYNVVNHPDRAIYVYPGSSVPEWMENKTTKDYIIIDLSSAPASARWGFIFCFVFGQYQVYIRRLDVKLIISDEDGEGKKDSVRMCIHDTYVKIELNHVCMMYDQRCSRILNSRAKNQTRFKIQLEIYDETGALPQEVLIKGFGVRPISSSAYGNFIQQIELRGSDRDSKYQIH